jgi:hypothetical protein
VLSRLSPRLALNVVAVVLTLAAIPWVLNNQSRPLIGPYSILTVSRTDQYFANRRIFAPPNIGAANFLKESHCATVGLIDNIDDWEYPLWDITNSGSQPVAFEHILVTNQSGALADAPPYNSFQPCAIVVIRQQRGPTINYHGASYQQKWTSDMIMVYLRQ